MGSRPGYHGSLYRRRLYASGDETNLPHQQDGGPGLHCPYAGQKDSACLYYAMKHAPKGSVLVIDHTGDLTYACVGEMVALLSKCQGFAGIVLDGPATDSPCY